MVAERDRLKEEVTAQRSTLFDRMNADKVCGVRLYPESWCMGTGSSLSASSVMGRVSRPCVGRGTDATRV